MVWWQSNVLVARVCSGDAVVLQQWYFSGNGTHWMLSLMIQWYFWGSLVAMMLWQWRFATMILWWRSGILIANDFQQRNKAWPHTDIQNLCFEDSRRIPASEASQNPFKMESFVSINVSKGKKGNRYSRLASKDLLTPWKLVARCTWSVNSATALRRAGCDLPGARTQLGGRAQDQRGVGKGSKALLLTDPHTRGTEMQPGEGNGAATRADRHRNKHTCFR